MLLIKTLGNNFIAIPHVEAFILHPAVFVFLAIISWRFYVCLIHALWHGKKPAPKHQRHSVGRFGASLSLSPLLIFSAFPSHAADS